jgi:hypothetical protein
LKAAWWMRSSLPRCFLHPRNSCIPEAPGLSSERNELGRLPERLQSRASFIDSMAACDRRSMIPIYSVEVDA